MIPQGVIELLPTVNALLNSAAFVLLLVGYRQIRVGQIARHRRAMLAAFSVSGLFLVSYLTYHAEAGSRPFPGSGPIRVAYLAMLATHIVLAAAIVPMALLTLKRGLASDFAKHKRIARWTLPMWLYVSVTGVLVFLALYVAY